MRDSPVPVAMTASFFLGWFFSCFGFDLLPRSQRFFSVRTHSDSVRFGFPTFLSQESTHLVKHDGYLARSCFFPFCVLGGVAFPPLPFSVVVLSLRTGVRAHRPACAFCGVRRVVLQALLRESFRYLRCRCIVLEFDVGGNCVSMSCPYT